MTEGVPQTIGGQQAWWRYIAALPITLVGLALGNLAGIVFTAVAGFHAMAPEKPGGVVLAAFQAFFGAMLAFYACKYLLKSEKYANPWLLLLVSIGALFAVIGYPYVIFWLGHTELLNWNLASGVSGLAVTEITRRTVKRDGID